MTVSVICSPVYTTEGGTTMKNPWKGLPKPKRLLFEITCVHSTNELITDMVHVSERISYRVFRKHVGGDHLDMWALVMGYTSSTFPREGSNLLLSKDWHVSYHKSVYDGRPCVYLCHSAIEHIWAVPNAYTNQKQYSVQKYVDMVLQDMGIPKEFITSNNTGEEAV